MNTKLGVAIAACVTALSAAAAEDATAVASKEKNDAPIAKVVVDSAPGNVSAMGLLGIADDQTTIVQNPRNLTIGLKALDGKNAFGLAITPARTSLLPMSIARYHASPAARLWAATTFSYAQGQTEDKGAKFNRRAFAVETSYFFSPEKDDPLMMYWAYLEKAAAAPIDDKNPCVLIPAQLPDSVKGDELNAQIAKRAQDCRDKVAKDARWNVSRAWASVATGSYQPAGGGDSKSLGRTLVLGVTWGIGDAGAPTAAALTAAVKHSAGAPVADTMGDQSPVRKSSNLATARAAVGSPNMRFLLEASNAGSQSQSALDRTFKRALGVDLKVGDGLWLNLRAGKQRRLDDKGDETASSMSLNFSPKALLGL